MGIIGWIVLGLLAGIIAKAIFPGVEALGIIMTTLLGIAGALLGGFVAWLVGVGDPIDEFFDISTWIAAIVGALVILFVASKVGAGRGTSTQTPGLTHRRGEADRGRERSRPRRVRGQTWSAAARDRRSRSPVRRRARCCRSAHETSGFSFANRRKSQNAITRQRSRVRAVTVAVRSPSAISASSPKWSPGPILATSLPSTVTDASPSATMKKPTPLIVPSLTTSTPGRYSRTLTVRASRFSWRWLRHAKSRTRASSSTTPATRRS